ncbi:MULTISPECIES: L-rhamnose mutarotase [unclassified Leeuwenhoekiella]|uniref:L-rhamnose mutarotase n=1 Tax=unclassified Leeuwenhoekiella TaxID=2615029 RepID=UPI000C46EE00|nr:MULTISPECIES: L-rhamnose mutarotase [unclassified Leeuwenhoekiella]MAW93740.1 L-fucose mutarotase [Leeuwenhoekiella sp.]MBA83037.1 L-fucose mutarotase [Leeuwenhoekiella sp.]|tara:strand:+ start:19057 stop:19398 length:342 start_codon:yes stop_codon:yes gene_type:complete
MKTTRHYFACDLKDDADLIAEYEKYHKEVWPEVLKSIKDAGISDMEIYRCGNRLFMIMETTADYDPERKKQMDLNNPKVQEWENLMWKYQQALPFANPGEKWIEMKQIFKLAD